MALPEGRFAIKFSTIAIFFIIFDIELIFVWPWAALYRQLGWFGFGEMIVFLGVHSLRIVADGWRSAQIARIGLLPYKAIYSAVSLLGLALIVVGYGQARAAPVLLWDPPLWLRHISALLMLFAFVLVAAALAKIKI